VDNVNSVTQVQIHPGVFYVNIYYVKVGEELIKIIHLFSKDIKIVVIKIYNVTKDLYFK